MAHTGEKKTAPAAQVQHASLAAALAAFIGECPPIHKANRASVPTKSGGQYSYDYADLHDVLEVVNPVLARHGLHLSTPVKMTKRGFGIRWKLRHVSGQTDKGFYPLPDPLRTPPQEMGSMQTYDRRYIVCSVLGVAPGGDDDDAQTAQRYAEQQQRQREQAQQRPARRGGARQQQPQQEQQRVNEKPTEAQWLERANAAQTLAETVALWREARSTGADAAVVDKLAIICQERKAAEDAQAAAQQPEAAPEAAAPKSAAEAVTS